MSGEVAGEVAGEATGGVVGEATGEATGAVAAASPYVVAGARVEVAERVSPSFVRVTFGGGGLDELGDVGAVFDQRIKLVFPPGGGVLPDLAGASDWYAAWLAVPEAARGAMRTYSVRELRVDGGGTRLVVDFVLHLEPGLTGPASRWASSAAPGDRVLVVGPRRGRSDGSGIEYAPGEARSVVLAGDETAAPAIARILEDAPGDLRGVAFVEVPCSEDALPIAAPAGVEVRWLPRDGLPHGAALLPAVLRYLGAGSGGGTGTGDVGGVGGAGGVGGGAEIPASSGGVDAEDLLWETPRYSGLGEALGPVENRADRYFWIAGESAVVTTLRRHLVRDRGVDRSQVAFMGYWRRGVAMRG